jgi:ribose transport system permease protein
MSGTTPLGPSGPANSLNAGTASPAVMIGEPPPDRRRTLAQRLMARQSSWVAVGLIVICLIMSWLSPDAFATMDNFYNITRNFAFIGMMALGMTAVIITGGIDLSVGSLMGLVGIVSGLCLQAGLPWYVAMIAGLLTGLATGAVNGVLIAYLKLSPFVVTLGMLSIARSLAIVLSGNRMIYDFGPDAETVFWIGGGDMLGIANPVWMLLIMTAFFAFIFAFSGWGRYLYAIGGNEQAARLTGVPVDGIKLQAYMVSALTASISAVMIIGWQGSAINALGQGYELRVIASAVIGGANLMGGEGGAFGAFIGAALIEVIRNSLLMAGVDSNWQGAFVGVFIILAVLLEKIRGRKAD